MSTNPPHEAAGAADLLREAFGSRLESEVATGWAPGRCTIVGEHVDYAGGAVLCAAIDRGVAVALRSSPDRTWRATSAGRVVERASTLPVHDIGDRIFGAALSLERIGIAASAIEVAVVADLPEGAGLASSAAVCCATIVALLRRHRRQVRPAQLVDLALHAERDIVGVPCGSLDQRAIVEGVPGGALLLDFASGEALRLLWPWDDVVLVACDSGEQHDVGGEAYRARRAQCDQVLALLAVENCQEIDMLAVDAAGLPELLRKRARHLAGETARSRLAADALRAGDAEVLGRLMTASHRSLVGDFDAGTALIGRMVDAALRVEGVHGARMVGAGFGGAVIALCARESAERCAAAMAAAAGRTAAQTWLLRPSGGLSTLAPDVVAGL